MLITNNTQDYNILLFAMADMSMRYNKQNPIYHEYALK